MNKRVFNRLLKDVPNNCNSVCIDEKEGAYKLVAKKGVEIVVMKKMNAIRIDIYDIKCLEGIVPSLQLMVQCLNNKLTYLCRDRTHIISDTSTQFNKLATKYLKDTEVSIT